MPLKDRVTLPDHPEQVDAFLANEPRPPPSSRSGTCHKTQETFAAMDQAPLSPAMTCPSGSSGWWRPRPASNHVAALTGITHESPQLILFKDGKAVFDRDNWDITDESVAEALEGHFARV